MNPASDHGKMYLATATALLGLLVLTIGAAYINLGPFNTIASLSISIAKALLIILVFMNARRSSPLIWIAAVAGFFWLGIMLLLAMSDFLTRGWR